MAISVTKGQEWRAITTQYRKASDILTSTLAAFLFSSHQNRNTSYDIRAWKRSGSILVEWEGMKSKKIDEAWIRK